jgi:hypothetical protein
VAFCLQPSLRAFGSDWAQLEASTCGRGNLPFRDPLNKERRFIPLRLDDAPIKGSLAQFLYINWRPAQGEQEPAKRCVDAKITQAPGRLARLCSMKGVSIWD